MSLHTDDEYADAILKDAHRVAPKTLLRILTNATTTMNQGVRSFMLALTPDYYTDNQYAETMRIPAPGTPQEEGN